MIRFEKTGKHDFAVYVKGESDAIGKAGVIGADCWFLARADLGGEIAWGVTMTEAVVLWAKGFLAREMERAAREKLLHPEWFEGVADEN